MARKYAAALIDLSGTLHIEDLAIPGAVDAMRRLRASGIKVKFLTNTTKEPFSLLHSRLVKLGFDVDRDEIFTSLTAARQFVDVQGLRPLLLLEEAAKEDFAGVCEDDPNSVVIGLSPSCFNYEKLNQAFRCQVVMDYIKEIDICGKQMLLLNGATLVAIHKGKYFMTKNGLSLGPGAFITGLEYAAGVNAVVVGKPERSFFHVAVNTLDVETSETVMIGDDVRDDILGALDAGLNGILVQTGKYRPGDESKIPTPSADVCRDFPAAVDRILNNVC